MAMANQQRPRSVRIFISSPGDLSVERRIVESVLQELNRSDLCKGRFDLIPYTFEAAVPARMGVAAQELIDAYMLGPADCDIFICMMWLRMGTPTQTLVNPDTNQPYQSGTEYEFLTAYRAIQQHKRPLVLLYRCVRSPDDIVTLDADQYGRVQAFFKRFESGRDLLGLVRTFSDIAAFERTVQHDLEQVLIQDPDRLFGGPPPISLDAADLPGLIDSLTSKVVLILGRFVSERKDLLDRMRDELRKRGYMPVHPDFEPQQDKPILETVKTLTNLARFVIADLTDPNMVRRELTWITANAPAVPVQPVMRRDAKLPTEYGTWKLYRSFLPVYLYDDPSHLLANLTEAVITPVEGHVVARHLTDANNP